MTPLPSGAGAATDVAVGEPSTSTASWAERAADRAPLVRRSRDRGVQQATSIVEAAERLIASNKASFTMQQLLKEAGIALQTFYRYFEGKDQLLLAVIENMVGKSCTEFRESARDLPDPVSRLRSYITSVVTSLDATGDNSSGPRFITTEHWRLFPLYPAEVTRATQPFSDLLLEEIDGGWIRHPDRDTVDPILNIVKILGIFE